MLTILLLELVTLIIFYIHLTSIIQVRLQLSIFSLQDISRYICIMSITDLSTSLNICSRNYSVSRTRQWFHDTTSIEPGKCPTWTIIVSLTDHFVTTLAVTTIRPILDRDGRLPLSTHWQFTQRLSHGTLRLQSCKFPNYFKKKAIY